MTRFTRGKSSFMRNVRKASVHVSPHRDSDGFIIRPTRPGDVKSIAELSMVLGYPVSAGAMRSRTTAVSKRKDQQLFVAEVEGTVVAWLEVFRPLSVLNWGKVEIGALVVDSRYRRRGVAEGLMHEAHAWAERKRAPFVYLRSNAVRKDAHEFYKGSGYEIYKTQYVFRRRTGKPTRRKHA
jgi:GNAT superfamily N-acetyltransferase